MTLEGVSSKSLSSSTALAPSDSAAGSNSSESVIGLGRRVVSR